MKKLFSNDKLEIWEFTSGGKVIQLEFSIDGYIALRTDEDYILLDKEQIELINKKTGWIK